MDVPIEIPYSDSLSPTRWSKGSSGCAAWHTVQVLMTPVCPLEAEATDRP